MGLKGENMPLSMELIEQILQSEGSGSTRSVGKRFGVSHVTVWNIWNGRRSERKSLEERFFDKVHKTSGCWLWTGTIDRSTGYGTIKVDGKTLKTHRVSLQLCNINVEGKVVRHSCDNPPCVNPSHLSLGTHADNVADRVCRDRSAVGTKNGRAKLTEDQVVEIFQDLTTTKAELARRFSVDSKVISNIQSRKSWKTTTVGCSR